MKGDPHLRRSTEPLIGHGDEIALCGKTVPNAEMATLTEEMESPMDHPRLCKVCKAIAVDVGRVYEYAVVAGQEARGE